MAEPVQVVLKYPLPRASPDPTELELPCAAALLSVAAQGWNLVLWAAAPADAPIEVRRFLVVTTGMRFTVPRGREVRHVGTVQQGEPSVGPFYVVHVFELA